MDGNTGWKNTLENNPKTKDYPKRTQLKKRRDGGKLQNLTSILEGNKINNTHLDVSWIFCKYHLDVSWIYFASIIITLQLYRYLEILCSHWLNDFE